MKQQIFSVSGMSCVACSARVEKIVANLPGINTVQVNLLTRSMLVNYDDKLLQEQQIKAAVEQAGYGVSSAAPTKRQMIPPYATV